MSAETPDDPNAGAPTLLASEVAASPGMRIGPYKLLQQIGQGGFGIVFLAEQEHPVRRTVALKIIKPGMDTREVVARFEAERQALALMDHLHIARVLDAGATEAGRPYFVMELVKGIPITEYCNANKLTPRERLELFVPVCHAIQHAHQKGIIHRDIKPSNVLVCLYDGRPVPKIIDFGVAKAIDQRLTEKTMFTHHGQVIGTLEYMSPEQAELSQLDIDTRSDIYSLGVLLYELLTGSTPITREQLRQVGFTEMLKMIREIEPEKPSSRLSKSHETLATISAQRRTDPSRLSALVKGELDWMVMKALEKDRTRRYETANSFARDIERYLRDEPVEACPPSAAYQLRKLVRRHRNTVVVGGVILALLIGMLANYSVGYYRLEDARKRIADEAKRARDAEAIALKSAEEAFAHEHKTAIAEEATRAALRSVTAAEKKATQALDRATALGEAMSDALARSKFDQARVVRLSGQSGRRWAALDLLKQAEQLRGRTRLLPEIGPDLPDRLTLRNEAVAAVMLMDGRVVSRHAGQYRAISPDGQCALVMVSGDAGTPRFSLSQLSSKKVTPLPELDGEFTKRVFLGPRGEHLAVESREPPSLAVWDLVEHRCLREVPLGETPSFLREIVFSPAGARLAIVGFDNQNGTAVVKLWEFDRDGPARIVSDDAGSGAVTFSPDGTWLVVGSSGNEASLHKVSAEGSPVRIELPGLPRAMGFHPHGEVLAILSDTSDFDSMAAKLIGWSVSQKQEVFRRGLTWMRGESPFLLNRAASQAVVLDRSGRILAIDSPFAPVGEIVRLGEDDPAVVASWNPEGELVTADSSGIKVWEIVYPPARTQLHLKGVAEKVEHVASLAENLLAVEMRTGEVLTVNRTTGEQSWLDMDGMRHRPGSRLKPTSEGKELIRCSMEGVTAWDATSGKRHGEFSSLQHTFVFMTSAARAPNGSLLVAGIKGGVPTIWNATANAPHWQGGPETLGTGVLISADGRQALTYPLQAITPDPSLSLWNLQGPTGVHKLPLPDRVGGQSLSDFSPDGRWAMTMYWDADVSRILKGAAAEQRLRRVSARSGTDREWCADIWDARSGTHHTQIWGPSHAESWAFSPDGRYLAVMMRRGAIRTWDIQQGAELFDWTPFPGRTEFPAPSLTFTRDSRTLVVPDPTEPVLHMLDLILLYQELRDVSLEW